MKEVLRDIKGELKPIKKWILDWVTISTAYKSKALKVRPIDKNNRTGGTSGGKLDWYECLFGRDIPQEHISQFKDYLLL